MPLFENIKVVALAALIGIGFHTTTAKAGPLETLTVAGGCFWCVESDFETVPGVTEVVSGFTGGQVSNPTYKQVVRGGTGHYEAVQITFDPDIVSRRALLDMFIRSIDPTDAGGQFCDRGDAYRTAIFVSDTGEKSLAEAVTADAQATLGQPIATRIERFDTFYAADDGHQDYYKGSSLVLTRFGPKRQSEAYKAYRKACGRDQRVQELWGAAAPFVGS